MSVDKRGTMVAVSKGGTKCTTFAQCRELIENGEDIDYDGISGPIEFTDDGDPGSAQIGIFEYNADNAYERIKTVEGTMEATS